VVIDTKSVYMDCTLSVLGRTISVFKTMYCK